MKIAALFLAMIAAPAIKAEAPKGKLAIPTQNGFYYVDPDRFRLGYTVLMMKSGYPVGQTTGNPKELGTPETPEEMNRQMEYAIKENGANQERLKVQAEGLQVGLTKSAPVPQTQARENAAAATEAQAFEFESCAKQALVLLKHKIQLDTALSLKELQGPDLENAVRTQAAVSAQLQRFRGAGGLACARGDAYLDAVVLASDTDQVRALTALLMRKLSERMTLKRTLAIAYTPKYPVKVRSVWNVLWIRQALVASFTSDKLPSYAQIAAQLAAANTHERTLELKEDGVSVSVPIVRDLTGVEESIQAGMKLLEQNYGHL